MIFFNGLFSNDKKNDHTFPRENNRGKVEIINDKIVYKGTDYYDPTGEVEIHEIHRIYIGINKEKEAFLWVCTYNMNANIPVYYKGFRIFYEALFSKFSFDDKLFWQTVYSKNPIKKLLWKKTFEPTYHILSDARADYGIGFEIQSPVKEFISWDMLFSELKENKNADLLYNENVNALSFKYPVRVGRLLFDGLTAHNYYRSDIAIQFVRAIAYDHNATDKSYLDIHNCILADLPHGKIVHQWDDEDGKTIWLSVDNILIQVSYRYDNEYDFEDGYTRIHISNEREYPHLLENKPYEDVMEVSDYLLLKSDVNLSGNYKQYSYPKRRPPLLDSLFGKKNIIWRDDVNNKIGFASDSLSFVLDKKDIYKFSIDNLIPAKGSGGSTLMAELCEGSETGLRSMYTFQGEYRSLNEYAEKIQSVTHKEVIFSPEFSDC